MTSTKDRLREGTLARLENACVHYADVVALAPTDLEVASGETIALVGSNGSGKSTLLHLLAGLTEPTDGNVDRHCSVALVAQHQHHHSWMPLSVEEVLRMGRYRSWVRPLGRADRQAIERAAERLDVAHLRRRPFGELSGGQQQRVLVAKAIAAEPDLLLLDEPITGLDLPSQATILEVISEQAQRGGAAVFSTHHLGEARRADRVLLLAGCVLADGRPDDVLVPDLLAEAFGGRMIAGTTMVIDEHHHDDHAPSGVADLATHLDAHRHEHDHGTIDR